MIREPILFRPFFSLLLLLSFSPFCTYEPTSQIHPSLRAISRLVIPSLFHCRISFSYWFIFVYFLGIAKPPRVVLLSYTGRFFVYCLLFTDLFIASAFGVFFVYTRMEAFQRNAQPASNGCSLKRVWEVPNKHFCAGPEGHDAKNATWYQVALLAGILLSMK